MYERGVIRSGTAPLTARAKAASAPGAATSALWWVALAAAAILPSAVRAEDREAIYVSERSKAAPWHAGWSDAHVTGDLIFVSGVVVMAKKDAGAPEIEKSFERAFAYLKRTLAAAGADLGDVVDYTVYLTDIDSQSQIFGDVRLKHSRPPYASSTIVQVERLIMADAIGEIRVVARRPKKPN